MDPFAKWLIKPRVTDKNGNLEFTGLYFSSFGNIYNSSAKFRIQFLCGLAKSQEYVITVTSRISKLSLLPLPTTPIYVAHDKYFEIISVLTALDNNSVGVPGKNIQKIEILNAKDLSIEPTARVADMGISLYWIPTGSDGMVNIYLKFKYVPPGRK